MSTETHLTGTFVGPSCPLRHPRHERCVPCARAVLGGVRHRRRRPRTRPVLPDRCRHGRQRGLADNEIIAEALTDKAPFVWLFQVVTVLTAVLITVFAAGLFRRLSQQGPADSLTPMLAVGGLFLVAAMQLVGSGICTEMFWGLIRDTDELDADTLGAQIAIFNTMGWVWVGAGIAAGAVAVAGLRHGAVGRGLAIGSAIAATLIALAQRGARCSTWHLCPGPSGWSARESASLAVSSNISPDSEVDATRSADRVAFGHVPPSAR